MYKIGIDEMRQEEGEIFDRSKKLVMLRSKLRKKSFCGNIL